MYNNFIAKSIIFFVYISSSLLLGYLSLLHFSAIRNTCISIKEGTGILRIKGSYKKKIRTISMCCTRELVCLKRCGLNAQSRFTSVEQYFE
jgi:hypothetical protein